MTTLQATENELNFKRVEAIRDRLHIRQQDMASLFGVTRMTYHRWINGHTIRSEKRKDHVRAQLRLLLFLAQQGWPTDEVLGLEPEERFKRLLQMMP